MPSSGLSDGSLDELDRTPTRLFTGSSQFQYKGRSVSLQLDVGSAGVGTSSGYAAEAGHTRGISSKASGNRKRKRNVKNTSENEVVDDQDLEEPSLDVLEAIVSTRSRKRLRIATVEVPGLVFPKSLYHGCDRPSQICEERKVLKEFLDEQSRQERLDSASRGALDANEFIEFQLTDFSIYIRGSHRLNEELRLDHEKSFDYELVPLHALLARNGISECSFYFDGALINGTVKRYVERVPFELLSIGNYQDVASHSVGDQIWICSDSARRANVSYQLVDPNPEYERYHTPFLWLANFSKHFVDYLSVHEMVVLSDFRERFYDWLINLHGHDTSFRNWCQQYGDNDFRRVIAANTEFLWKEATNEELDPEHRNRKQPIWSEVDTKCLSIIKEEEVQEKKTVVTPFVFEVFKDMEWANCMDSRNPSPAIASIKQPQNPGSKATPDMATSSLSSSEDELGLNHSRVPQVALQPAQSDSVAPASSLRRSLQRCSKTHSLTQNVPRFSIGDVVTLLPDTASKWTSTAELWFAYVQSIERASNGSHLLGLLWLYSPSDTTCGNGRYPFSNELFLSDNCSCEDKPTYSSDVISKIAVSFFGSPGHSEANYFVRQTYRSVPGQEAFVTLRQSDFKCWHQSLRPKSDLLIFMEKYEMGDTILVCGEPAGTASLEPVEIVSFGQDSSQEAVQVRRLPRRRRHYQHEEARPNELIYTDDVYSIPVERLMNDDNCRRCYIRFYTPGDLQQRKIPAPYSRDGTADAYYIIYRQAGSSADEQLEPITESTLMTLKQGFDPLSAPTRSPLRGMDLYCGGGNFGRGLEEGGAVQNLWAVDWAKHAMHTYRANLKDPDATKLYYGSVNDYLAKAMQGTTAKNIAKRGEVDFISAGSPCQGFSTANQNKQSQESLQNSSMVSSVAAFIDFYRPKYALLENVTAMTSGRKNSKEATVFSQLLCCLVAMGYQVQQFNIDAWSFGSPQSRRRLFISIAAPGLELPPYPGLTHAHPPTVRNARLGIAANGLSFGERRTVPTPFEYISASEATKDLPSIGDGREQTCIRYPDHRSARVEKTRTRVQISQIPRNPRGQTFITACNGGRIGKPQLERYTWGKSRSKPGARSWGRINPNGLIPTITTKITPHDAFSGPWLHWDEHRLLTVMEARRAQGFPDHEVLVGYPATQWKTIGNSVARTVALALGMSLRSAWLANPPDNLKSISLPVGVDLNIDVGQGKSLIRASSLSSKTSVIAHLGEEESQVFTKKKLTTHVSVSAPLQGSHNISEKERIACKSKTYRRLTAAATQVHNSHSTPNLPAHIRERDLAPSRGSTSSAKQSSKQVARGPQRSVAVPSIQSPSPPFSFLKLTSCKTRSSQGTPESTSNPTIVISDSEEEVVYLGTSTSSSRDISSAQETPENPRSSRTSVEADWDELYPACETNRAGFTTDMPAQRTASTMAMGRPMTQAIQQPARRWRPRSNNGFNMLPNGVHGLLQQKPSKQTVGKMRH
ncbi:MAG: DNA methyltransferase Dim-2 [Candelina submexicana]|nr:MAG: DNA methyltransferase Dim-2 [Candelina submexicana]